MLEGIMKNKKYKIISCNVLWREICYFAALSKNEFEFTFLPWGLHREPDQLRKDVQKAINETENHFDAILLGYGLCSKGLEGITAHETKLIITKAHDCITCFLGSRERYRKHFDSNPGTYWYTPGWIENHLAPGKERYEVNYNNYVEKYGEDNAQYLMEMEQNWFKEYTSATYVDLGFGDTTEYEEYTQDCAKYLNWKYDKLEGDATLIKNILEGNWDEDMFLIVEPGYKIKATNDENIMESIK
jgi:hypothetical protein